jgi:hypothetical protein
MSFVHCYLPYFRQWLITLPLSALLPFQPLFTEICMEINSLLLPPSLMCSEYPTPSAEYSFSVHCLLLSFFLILFLWSRGQSVQGAMLVYSKNSCGVTACHLLAHLLVCISQAGFELASGGVGALLFSPCNLAWRSFS